MCASGVLGDCGKVRLSDGSDVSILGRSFTSLAGVFNIVHTFVCGDDVGASTINANELISDGALNVNSETKALTCANSQPMSNSKPTFIYTQKQLLVVIL